MGSRKQPVWGGSGLPHTRRSKPKPAQEQAIQYAPIETIDQLNLYLSGDKITCLLCGKEYKSLGHHLQRSHSMSSREYKVRFNIPVCKSLVGDGLKKIKKSMKTWRLQTNKAA